MLGEFRLLRRLGRGGMAEVWLAEQTSLDRKVAVKLLRPELMQEARHVARFRREATAAGGLNHPNIIQVHTIGEDGGQHYIAQEYVAGKTLKQFLNNGPPSLSVALHIMRQVAAALKAAADAGIVHRDIKPENIMLTRTGEAKVADFGLAQLFGGEEGVNITQEGVTLGTPLYMSPEQIHGNKVDPRSDLYSFGVTCYHMLTGRPPFEGPTAMSIAVKHLQEEPVPLSELRSDLPPELVAIVHRMMAKKADDRYQSAAELLTDLKKLTRSLRVGTETEEQDFEGPGATVIVPAGRTQPSRRRSLVWAGAVLIAAGCASAALGWFMRPADPLTLPPRPVADIQRLPSAREQYVHAMLLGNNPDAFQAVIDNWSSTADREWVRRAQEQLALLCLKDRHRWDEAERLFNTIESYGAENGRYRAEALAGRAALRAYQGNVSQARNLLQSQFEPLRDRLPEGSAWLELADEARRLIAEAEQRQRSGSR
jgi:serine/threonine-protein kinase